MLGRFEKYRQMIVVCLLFILTSCATKGEKREITDSQSVIDDVEFYGVARFKKKELLQYLYIGETSPLPFTETFYFNEARVPLDSERILALYRAHGYYDARVEEFRVEPSGKKKKKVDLFITVHEGEPVTIEEVRVTWPEGPPKSPLKGTLDVQKMEQKMGLREGDPLEVSRLQDAARRFERMMQNDGFALAQVSYRAVVSRENKRAEVHFTVLPGPFARIGSLRFEGLVLVPQKLLLREVEFARGEPFSPSLLKKVERAIYALEVFRTVEVIPGDSLDADQTLPVTIVVSESKLQSIKIGVGLAFEPARWEERITSQYTHRSIWGELTRLDVRLRAGYAELPTAFNVEEHGPVAELEPRLTKKGLLEKRMIWSAAPAIELGINEGYQFYSPSCRLTVSRFFAQIFEAKLSYNFRFVDFFNLSDELDSNRSLLGLDFRDPYMLSYVELETFAYFTDSIFEPHNGVVLGARYTVAGGILGGSYDYQKISPLVRVYWQMVSRVQLALRLETGYILPYGEHPSAPFNMKFYLGGADSVRGWGLKRLSPKTEICPENGDEACRHIPIGGKTYLLGNVELRVRTIDALYAVAFCDMGDVQAGAVTYRPGHWNYSAGGGLRYDSPIGKFRLDFGFRLNDTPLSKGQSIWAFHLGLGEAF